ncbi:hypothetical protein [Hyphobacterium sp.]|uniref:hypothetical protein n=1 Tax=Hyphobacterium sp. TaxID=2004662 RepID=UPI00374A43EA
MALVSPGFADPELHGATAPATRTVATDQMATAFFTVLNSGDLDATNCQLNTTTFAGSNLDDFVIENRLVENGVATGDANPSFTVSANGRVDLVVGVSKAPGNSFINDAYVHLFVTCDNNHESLVWPAVNEFHAQFRDSSPDIILAVETLSNDGIARFNETRTAAIAIAAMNIGEGDGPAGDPAAPAANEATVEVRSAYPGPWQQGLLDIFVCQTDASGACMAPPVSCLPSDGACLSVPVGTDPVFFTYLLRAPDQAGTPFLPAIQRFQPILRSPTSFNDAANSVALGAVSPREAEDTLAGQYLTVSRNTNEAEGGTITSGRRVFDGEDGFFGRFTRAVDRGAFTQLVDQSLIGIVSEALSQMDFAALDTREEGNDRPNDHYHVDGDRSTCALTAGQGGRCAFSAGQAEQVPGQEVFFDAGEEYVSMLVPDDIFVDPRVEGVLGRISDWRMRSFRSNTLSVDYEDTPFGNPSSDLVSGEFGIVINGCPAVLVVQRTDVGVSRTNADITRPVFSAYIRIDADRCDNDSFLGRMAAARGQDLEADGATIVLITTVEEGLFGEVAFRFTITGENTDVLSPALLPADMESHSFIVDFGLQGPE